MITKEQIDEVRALLNCHISQAKHAQLRHVYEMALETVDAAIEGEADRKLGAAVRAFFPAHVDASHIDCSADAYGGDQPAEDLLRCIASALREEGER